jgi:glycerol-1-phosphate dehydrogenase [NAD(P)+]
VGDPEGVRRGDPEAIANLAEGLLMGGFAMQAASSSRPASGAEHQFSHLWDMQDHRYHGPAPHVLSASRPLPFVIRHSSFGIEPASGRTPFHGYKVGIGTLASARLYEWLFEAGIERLDAAAAANAWPDAAALEALVAQTHASPALRAYALQECRAKHIDREHLVRRLERLKAIWPELRVRLQSQLLPSETLRRMLAQAGAPVDPAEIGIDPSRLRRSHVEAQQIRRRYTVLDLATETALLPTYLEHRFGPAEQ